MLIFSICAKLYINGIYKMLTVGSIIMFYSYIF
jgi:hypothetical protein